MTNLNAVPIVLLTDFGVEDVYAGILKGVILSINPGACIVDLSHSVGPQDIRQGAFLLSSAAPYFPRGTVFCVVVDPGVGSERAPILVRTTDYTFIGPDNGVLFHASRDNGIRDIFHLNQPGCFLGTVSNTFHGRDIFAPVAAHFSLGVPAEKLGEKIESMVPLELAPALPVEDGSGFELSIIHKDRFGNLILNIRPDEFNKVAAKGFLLEYDSPGEGKGRIDKVFPAYSAAPDHTPFVLESSSGYMEIAVKNQSAARVLGLGPDHKIRLSAAP